MTYHQGITEERHYKESGLEHHVHSELLRRIEITIRPTRVVAVVDVHQLDCSSLNTSEDRFHHEEKGDKCEHVASICSRFPLAAQIESARHVKDHFHSCRYAVIKIIGPKSKTKCRNEAQKAYHSRPRPVDRLLGSNVPSQWCARLRLAHKRYCCSFPGSLCLKVCMWRRLKIK